MSIEPLSPQDSELLAANTPQPTVADLSSRANTISQYAVACGGFSDIYRGELKIDVDLYGVNTIVERRQVAIKLLRAFTNQKIDIPRALKRLNREVKVWAGLQHANIAMFYGVSFHMNKRPSIVMDWYANGDAPSYLKGHPQADRLLLIRDIAKGLQYLHSKSPPVVHGDLKGNNVLIDAEGRAVLSDFGLSKVIEELSGPTGNTTTMLAGAVRWQAPQLLYDGDVDPPTATRSSDVWSFACTAYELLTGQVPFSHISRDWKVVPAVLGGMTPVTPGDLVFHGSPQIWRILCDCWAYHGEDRPDISDLVSRL